MKHLKLYEDFINEKIKASEAYNTMNGVQTVIDNKRDLVFISTMDNPMYKPNNESELAAMQYGLENGLKAIEVKGKTDGRAWVLYKKNKKAAQKSFKSKQEFFERTHLGINEDLMELKTWTPKNIQDRSSVLLTYFLQEWPEKS